MALVGARSLTFREFHACGAPKFFKLKDPITIRRWLVNRKNAFRSRFLPEGSKATFASSLLKDRAHDWWEEVDCALGARQMRQCLENDFVMIFKADFVPVIEVQEFAREFQDLHLTTKTLAEITTMFRESSVGSTVYGRRGCEEGSVP